MAVAADILSHDAEPPRPKSSGLATCMTETDYGIGNPN
jgi:hypothetical protein